PVVAERATYFHRAIGAAGDVAGGAAAAGQPNPAVAASFAEGSTLPGFQTYLTILNVAPGPKLVHVITGPVADDIAIAGHGRVTVDVNSRVPDAAGVPSTVRL